MGKDEMKLFPKVVRSGFIPNPDLSRYITSQNQCGTTMISTTQQNNHQTTPNPTDNKKKQGKSKGRKKTPQPDKSA